MCAYVQNVEIGPAVNLELRKNMRFRLAVATYVIRAHVTPRRARAGLAKYYT